MLLAESGRYTTPAAAFEANRAPRTQLPSPYIRVLAVCLPAPGTLDLLQVVGHGDPAAAQPGSDGAEAGHDLAPTRT